MTRVEFVDFVRATFNAMDMITPAEGAAAVEKAFAELMAGPPDAKYRMWAREMTFKKNGFPSPGPFGSSSAPVVIMTTETWTRLCRDVPQLQTTQFEVGTEE